MIAWGIAAAGLFVLCLGFTAEIGSAVSTWNASTAYGHCWLVLPIVGWLLWERSSVIRAGTPRPAFWPALLAVPLVLAWLAADWLGIMEGRQLALVGLAELLLMAALGWRLWWALSPAFLYLFFLVPFGAFLTPALQSFTTNFILGGLRLFDVPFDADAFQITIPEGTFYVAEACAGLRFLIASVAFGVLYAITLFRSPGRRAAFIAVSFVVPILANGVRGLGIVLLGHVLGSAEAGAADHLIYGWVFFSLVILLLALAGMPFRQDGPPVPAPVAAGGGVRAGAVLFACFSVLVAGYAGPVAADLLQGGDKISLAASVPGLVVPATCRARAATVDGARSTQVLSCGPGELRVVTLALPASANPARLLDAARGLAMAGLGKDVDSEAWRGPGGARWMMLKAHDTGNQAAFALIVDHRFLLGGLRDRLRMMGAAHAVAVAVSARGTDLRGFLAHQGASALGSR